MKTLCCILIGFSSFSATCQNNTSIEIDSVLAKKITIVGFCLCKTNLGELQKLNGDLKSVDVEEMNLGKKCIAQDGRFVNGKGFMTTRYPGLIFQQDQGSDLISKIRMTKDFTGQLPDGTPIDMQHLILKDVVKIYPAMKNKWGSRPCSDYWNFSNDTFAFYVKIEKTKQPQFPIDEAYYLGKPIDGIELFISCYSLSHAKKDLVLFPANEPMYFIDSIRVNKAMLKNYEPEEIAVVSVYKDFSAIKLAGKDGKNGMVYIITKDFARESYWNYLKSKSKEYALAVPDGKTVANVVYILNGKVLKGDYEGDLFNINDTNFQTLTVINSAQLEKEYKISGKKLGVELKLNKVLFIGCILYFPYKL